MLGDFIVETKIIIEDDVGAFSLLTVAFLKTLGVWQVHNINDRQQSWLDAQKAARPLYWR
jgi:hypothetical protein